jgi:hypothetical protein
MYEYLIDPEMSPALSSVSTRCAGCGARRRDELGVYEDIQRPGVFVETFLIGLD